MMKFKKITSFVLLVTMLLPAVQITPVHAGQQPGITNFRISRTGAPGANHNITLDWDAISAWTFSPSQDRPAGSPDTNFNDRFEKYGVQSYEVSYKDVTRNDAATVVTLPNAQYITPPNTNVTLNGIAPNKGSLYSFTVTPYHHHPQFTNNQWVYMGTKITPNANQITEALLLTDIEVEAEGENGTLTITWDNPRYGNTQVFQSYKLYIARENSYPGTDVRSAQAITVTPAQCTQIPATTTKGPRLQYKLTDPNKIYSGFYDVAVEPCDSLGDTIRNTGQTATILVSGKATQLAYTPYSTAYQYKKAPVSLGITVVETGKDSAQLVWGDLSYIGSVNNMDVALFMGTDKAALEGTLARYATPNATSRPVPMIMFKGNITSYPIELPQTTVYYGIVVVVNGQTVSYIVSNVVAVNPASVQIRPNTPEIHQPIKGATSDNTTINIYWDAFLRDPYTNDRETSPYRIVQSDGRINDFTYDNNTFYELYIVDDMETFGYQNVPHRTLRPTDFDYVVTSHAKSPGTDLVPAFMNGATQYADPNLNLKAFEKNKLYYVKLVAYKLITNSSGGQTQLESRPPAYATFYIPITGDISSPPMLRKPPLSVRQDENGSDVITTTSIDVAWLEEWSEVYDYTRDVPDPSDPYNPNHVNPEPEWQTKAAKDGTTLYYGDETKGKKLIEFYKEVSDDFVAIIKGKGMLDIEAEVPVRKLNLKNCYYEATAILYSSFLTDVNGDFQTYLDGLLADPPTPNYNWRAVTPQTDADGNPYFTMSGLSPNMTYAILLKAYRIAPDGTRNYGYANFIAAATVPPETTLDITPTPPVVTAESSTDTAVTLRWVNTSSIDYELVYSDVFYQDIATQYTRGQSMSFADVMKNSTVRTDKGVSYRELIVEGLFPDTEYYFWVRARSQTNRLSAWSNPAYIRTKDIIAPQPPSGFGLASATDLGLINQAGGTKYAPREKNNITMEWSKDTSDTKVDGSGTSTAVADILSHPDLLATYIARFKGLISNKTYYFRAKTILTVTMGADKKTQSSYAYLIQISLEPDFINSSEIYVPSVPPEASQNIRQAESVWTKTIHFNTSTSGDDYDSEFDLSLIPLPEQDFEITYAAVGTLTYRFRTDQKDEKGNYDNRVDQRFISSLVTKGIHNYNIDVTKYEDRIINKRVIEVPYTLLKTFEERKISFGIRAGDVTLILPPGTMETALVQSVPDYGDKAKLHIIFDESSGKRPVLGMRQTYAMTPQDVSLYIWTPTQYLKMPYAGKPLGVKLKLDSRYALMDSNTGAYVKNEQTTGWTRVESDYDKESGQLKFETQPGVYAAIESQTPDTVLFDQSTPYMLNVASKLTVTDMSVYNGNAPASSNQMLNVMDAVINGKTSLAINKTPDPAAVSTLQKVGMNIMPGAAVVSREQAIANMVKLYERKTGSQIKPTYTLANTPYTDTASVQSAYQPAMLKAAEKDMLNGKTSIRPKDNLTLGELFELADVIISDAGL